jgi:hypothetical protein
VERVESKRSWGGKADETMNNESSMAGSAGMRNQFLAPTADLFLPHPEDSRQSPWIPHCCQRWR